MGHRECFGFGERNLPPERITGKDFLEVGAHMDGGSMRPYVESHGPRSYLGIDIQDGPGVDVVCDAMSLLDKFGPESCDVVIANELLEHLRDWRSFIHIVKNLVREDGMVILTTRSYGFPFHYAPFDYWRYEVEDMHEIFSDFEAVSIEPDTREVKGKVTPGVFVAVRKPKGFVERELESINLYSILRDQRVASVTACDILSYEFKELGLKYFWKHRGIPFLVRDFLSRRIFRPIRG